MSVGPARPEEEEALLDLWVAANPGSEREDWRRQWHVLPRRVEQTYVAVAGGNLLFRPATGRDGFATFLCQPLFLPHRKIIWWTLSVHGFGKQPMLLFHLPPDSQIFLSTIIWQRFPVRYTRFRSVG